MKLEFFFGGYYRDVSGVELLMNNHQSLKAEIDARDENFTICVNLGKDLVAKRHQRSPEVKSENLSILKFLLVLFIVLMC